jgi:hypothetical protein
VLCSGDGITHLASKEQIQVESTASPTNILDFSTNCCDIQAIDPHRVLSRLDANGERNQQASIPSTSHPSCTCRYLSESTSAERTAHPTASQGRTFKRLVPVGAICITKVSKGGRQGARKEQGTMRALIMIGGVEPSRTVVSNTSLRQCASRVRTAEVRSRYAHQHSKSWQNDFSTFCPR